MLLIYLLLGFKVVVQVERAPLKATPDFFSETISVVRYGNTLIAEKKQDGWFMVRYKGDTAFIHSSCVHKKALHLKLGNVHTSNSNSIALAAKGFTEQDILSVKGINRQDLKYLDSFKISENQLRKFKQEGAFE